MRVGVTGGGGRLGNVLVRELLALGHVVSVMEPGERPIASLAGLDVKLERGSVLDKEFVGRFVADVDSVYHLAAKIDLNVRKDPMLMPINVEGTRNIAHACRQRGIRMLHCSSHHALELRPFDEALTENKPLALNSGPLYHRSKAIAEVVVLEECQRGLDAVITNPGTLIGPHDFEPSLIGNAMIDLIKGRMPVLLDVLSDYADVRDVARGMIAAMKNGRRAERYLLVGPVITMREFAATLGAVSGKKMPRFSLPVWTGWLIMPFTMLAALITGRDSLFTPDVLHASVCNDVVSFDKATRELAYSSRPLKETLADCIAWYREQGWLA